MEINRENKYQKITANSLSLLMILGILTFNTTGAHIRKENTLLRNNKIVTSFTEPVSKIYTITNNRGTNINTDEQSLKKVLDRQEICSMDGTYYSKNSTSIMLIKATYIKDGQEKIIEYLLTPEEYMKKLNEILISNKGFKSYSAKLIEANPIEELYTKLNVEYENNLPKSRS